ncbi:MAG TPA: hypothetical protein VGD21_03665 [Lysobacter sp.]
MAVSLLAACPRSTPAPNTRAETQAAGTDDPPAMTTDPAQSSAATSPEPAQGKRAAGQENEPVLAWRAFGTEPFWGARVDGETLVFTTPEDQAGKTMRGRRVPSLVGFVFVGRDGSTEFHLGVTPGECSDGMSDNRYAFLSTFIYGGTTYKGCAEAAK